MKLLSRKDWANDVKQAVNAFIIDNYNKTNLKNYICLGLFLIIWNNN